MRDLFYVEVIGEQRQGELNCIKKGASLKQPDTAPTVQWGEKNLSCRNRKEADHGEPGRPGKATWKQLQERQYVKSKQLSRP